MYCLAYRKHRFSDAVSICLRRKPTVRYLRTKIHTCVSFVINGIYADPVIAAAVAFNVYWVNDFLYRTCAISVCFY